MDTIPAKMTSAGEPAEIPELKIDLGCGSRKREGFLGIDIIAFEGVDVVLDIGKERWPWADESVTEVFCSHFIEHLEPVERCHFLNELYRVLVSGAKCTLIVPHWASARAYGDPTHKWPPIGEFWFQYLNREWRLKEAPHTDIKYWKDGYACDFDPVWGYALHPSLNGRNQEYQQHAITHFKEATPDMHATLTKK